MSWFKKIFKSTCELAEFTQVFSDNENLLNSQRECFINFLSNHLEDIGKEIKNNLNEKNLSCVSVPEAFGFNYYLNEIRASYGELGYSSICIKASEVIRTAHQIALIILKEFKQRPSGDSLGQLKEYLKKNKFLIIIENSSFVSNNDLKLLFNCLQDSKVILIARSKSSFKSVLESENEASNILPLTNERAVELALSMLNYRSDLILTSAERSELIDLVSICDRMPELIFIALAGPQNERNLTIEKYCKQIKQRETSSGLNYYSLLNYKTSKLPEEVLNLLVVASHLPSYGFTLNDLYILCRNSFFCKEELNKAISFLTYVFALRVNDEYNYRIDEDHKVAMVYYLPSYIKEFINDVLNNKIETKEHLSSEEINAQLVQRLESNILWNEPVVWVTQFEHSVTAIHWIGEQKLFENNKYFVLYIQSLFAELGFWREIETILIPFCAKAITLSDNNEDRGFWYSLSGIMLKGISKYKEPDKQLELALISFQKSLKFYDPHRQNKRYSFVYQNMGLIYYELAELDENNPVYLKQAIKAFYKALTDNEDACSKNTVSIRRYLSQAYSALAKQEKPSENCYKAASLFIESVNALNNNIPDDPRIKLLFKELEVLNKLISVLANKSSEQESLKLLALNKEIQSFLKKDNKASISIKASSEEMLEISI